MAHRIREPDQAKATVLPIGTGVPRAPYLVPSNLVGESDWSVRSRLTSAPGIRCRFFDSGRAALYTGLRTTLTDKSGTALVPAYVCDEAIQPFRRFGLDVSYYRLQDGLVPDLDHLDEQWTDDVRAVVSVDYFGFPCPRFEEIAARCRQRDAIHVDDNAHSTLSASGARLLGTRGTFGITSFRKTLPTPDGGVLFERTTSGDAPADGGMVTGDRLEGDVDTATVSARDLSHLTKHLVRWCDTRVLSGSIQRAYRSSRRNVDRDGAFEVSRPSALTGRVLACTDATTVVERRRENYRILAGPVRAAETTTVLSPPLESGGGVCPQVLPVQTDDPGRLETVLASLSVSTSRWPTLPPTIENNHAYEHANYLADHLVAIPIHQRIDHANAQRLATRLHECLT